MALSKRLQRVRRERTKSRIDRKDAERFRWWLALWTADTDEAMDKLNDALKHAITPHQVRAAIDGAIDRERA